MTPQKMLTIIGGGIVGASCGPIFSDTWFIGMSGVAVIIVAMFIKDES